jgi:hypothetical protein
VAAPYSITNSILVNIIDTLEGINGAPNYTNTITDDQVSDADLDLDKHITEIKIFPFFSVINGAESRIYEPSFNRVTVNFNILCTFKNESELEMNSYIDDIERALAVDIRRGTTECWESKIISVSRDSYRMAEFRRWIIQVQAIYGYLFGQPGAPGS